MAGSALKQDVMARLPDLLEQLEDIHGAFEAGVLDHGEALIVIHRQHCIAFSESGRNERRIGRHRTEHVEAAVAHPCDGG